MFNFKIYILDKKIMALFGSNKEVKQLSKKIRPTVVRTKNVAKELINLAKSNKINPNELDFNILGVDTYTRISKDDDDIEWEEIESSEIHEIDDPTALLNARFEIKQMYEIEIFSKDKKTDVFKDFKAVVGANATKCKVYLSIKEGSKIGKVDNFNELFLDYINKSKIRAGILIDIFDEMLPEFISKVSAQIKVEGEVFYTYKETVLISNAYEPTSTIDDDIILHYDKDNTDNIGENEKIDYAKRGFIKSVMEDDLLIEYIKPKMGKAGRNCRGEFMEPKEPIVKNEPTFGVDSTIEIIDNKENIQYKAKESGYIALDNGIYQIKSDMDVDSVSFKSTGSITAGVNSDVVLNVKENDPEKDAIGSGMEVQVKEIDIIGNVGSNAKIHAKRANIEGQTHKSSEITADNLTINVHKGLATGENIHITRLEGGEVNGKSVDISQATGGVINAREIEIEICASHVKATASQRIEISKLQGSENIFTIDPLVQKTKQDDLDENQLEIQELEISIKDIKKEIEKYTKSVKNNMSSFNDIKRRLVNYKKNGIKMPTSFVTRYKQLKGVGEHLEAIKKEYAVKSDKLILLTSRTVSFQDNIFDARIINKDRWVGHNEIIFKLIDPPLELVFSPPEGSSDLIFAIVQKDDDDYEIKAVSE